MVLQREIPAPVWGSADPDQEVTVAFAGQTKSVKAGHDGKWIVRFDALPASAESRVMTVKSGGKNLEIKDVLVGDVWLASGQSNMGSPMSSGAAAAELANANDPLLRFFNVVKATAAEPQADLGGKWLPSTSENTKGLSAVAYFVAKEIRETQKVPVAILHSSWGGTPIQTWMSLDSIKRDPPIAETLADWDKAYAKHLEVKDKPEVMAAYLADQKDWDANVGPAFKAALSAYKETMAAAKAAGQPIVPGPKPARPEPDQPDPMAMPASSKRPHTPSVAYNATIAPLIPYGLRGMLWYQGEENGSTGLKYRVWFPRLIEGWRAAWGQGDVPFVFVQLPACYKDAKPVAESGWPFTREAQFMTLKVPNTAMAVTIDIGDPNNVHPDNKIFTGHRTALAARKLAYGEKIVASGPLYKDFAVEGDKIKIHFTETGGGLTIGQPPWTAAGVTPPPTDHLVGFYIAGDDKNWVEASAQIDGDSVVVSSPAVSKPTAVRYGWASSPKVNLYNKEGLAASPFRTDTDAAK